MADLITIEGYVESVIFRNDDNGYTVLSVIENGHEVTCVGIFTRIDEGEYVEVSGEMVKHPVYMEQLKVRSYQIKMPQDVESIRRYLASGAIKGIGEKMADRIVKEFGEDTFRIIEEEPERLADIKGISMRGAMEIADQIVGKQDVRKAMMFLQEYGINMTLANRIYQQYGNSVYSIIKENPYRLADDLHGVGFKMADEIAQRVGIFMDSDFRIRSGIMYQLLSATANGHMYLPSDELKQQTEVLLQLDIVNFEQYLMDLAIDKKVVIKERSLDAEDAACGGADDRKQDGRKPVDREQDASCGRVKNVYPFLYYNLEISVATMLKDLDVVCEYDEIAVEANIRQIEKKTGIVLDDRQRQAVVATAGHGLTVITGGPGTGKTTTINTIIRYFDRQGLEIRLAAPTGRAAKRMTETTGWEAQTIHRLLEVNGSPDNGEERNVRFERNETNPLETDVLIVDEMSMVDIHLMNSLLRAVLAGTRLILVGDVDQLPSVGPGNVLKDIIHSGCFNVIALEKIFRQSGESEIIVNAHKINRGEDVVLNKYSRDFLFVHREDADASIGAIKTLLRDKLPSYVGATVQEIQVLTPMRKGMTGVERLNSQLQEFLNPPAENKKEVVRGEVCFREGDKVMQIKNNYQLQWEKRSRYGIPTEDGMGVFNGDLGVILKINSFAGQVEVLFDDDRIATYDNAQLEELELAYAVTIHKSQGSEYPAVIVPMCKGPSMLMTRNLLYTAVTRAKTCVCLVGEERIFHGMIENAMEQKRYSTLKDRIRELYLTD